VTYTRADDIPTVRARRSTAIALDDTIERSLRSKNRWLMKPNSRTVPNRLPRMKHRPGVVSPARLIPQGRDPNAIRSLNSVVGRSLGRTLH